jgi:hypothetical protein
MDQIHKKDTKKVSLRVNWKQSSTEIQFSPMRMTKTENFEKKKTVLVKPAHEFHKIFLPMAQKLYRYSLMSNHNWAYHYSYKIRQVKFSLYSTVCPTETLKTS